MSEKIYFLILETGSATDCSRETPLVFSRKPSEQKPLFANWERRLSPLSFSPDSPAGGEGVAHSQACWKMLFSVYAVWKYSENQLLSVGGIV